MAGNSRFWASSFNVGWSFFSWPCFSPNVMVLFVTKLFYFGLICPGTGLPEGLWFVWGGGWIRLPLHSNMTWIWVFSCSNVTWICLFLDSVKSTSQSESDIFKIRSLPNVLLNVDTCGGFQPLSDKNGWEVTTATIGIEDSGDGLWTLATAAAAWLLL